MVASFIFILRNSFLPDNVVKMQAANIFSNIVVIKNVMLSKHDGCYTLDQIKIGK